MKPENELEILEKLKSENAELRAIISKQARDAKTEAALERVRSRSMAMHRSDELAEVVHILHKELVSLGVAHDCPVIMTHPQGKELVEGSEIWIPSEDREYFEKFDFPYVPGNPISERHRQAILDGADRYSDAFTKKEKDDFFSNQFEMGDLKQLSEDQKTPILGAGGFATAAVSLTHSSLLLIRYSDRPFSDEDLHLIERFGKVLKQAYTRFRDLLKAEHQAYQGRVESSLERVRAMAAAMNHSDDLMQIAEAMFKEMEILKINPLRYGLGMIDGENKEAELWASTVNDGHYLDMLGTISLTWHPMLEQVLYAWDGQHEELIYELKGKELSEYYQQIGKINPDIPNLTDLQDPDNNILQYVSFFPFKTGALYAFTKGKPGEEGRSILKRFASVFEQAHIRYEDLQTAEKQARLIGEERDRLAITLKELKATQEQLVQQEKLASLGQLTAGIAHEIKNPLNFVNNFSDLSVELVNETKEELQAVSDQLSEADQRKVEEALELLHSIEMNLKKIFEHGTRADTIVKSMLEHSRGGSGRMESTHLNSLVKEFVNLSFHGMRANKDPINVDITFELDEKVGEVPLIAEDFSRVIINLTNNAFDAMREKLTSRRSSGEQSSEYLPALTVRTKEENGKAVIEIEDNGPGIPDEMKDKIIQPFFTTKKGTEGTGLGLSITNDIVKAHGGTINLESETGSGTTFTINLTNR